MAYSATTEYFFPKTSISTAQLAQWITDANGIINEQLEISTDTTAFVYRLKAIEKELVAQEWTFHKNVSAKNAQMVQDPFGNALIQEKNDRPMHLTKGMLDELMHIKAKIPKQGRFEVIDT